MVRDRFWVSVRLMAARCKLFTATSQPVQPLTEHMACVLEVDRIKETITETEMLASSTS